MRIALIYKTDAWHTTGSKELIAISEPGKAIDIVNEYINQTHADKIQADDIYNLQHIQQTQNYTGEGEYSIEYQNLNTLTGFS